MNQNHSGNLVEKAVAFVERLVQGKLTGADKKGLGLSVVLLFAVGGAFAYEFFPAPSNEGYAPDQPIPFSHKRHAGQYEIPCLYCHNQAEKSNHATIPPVSLCMNCHKVVKTESPWIQKLTEYYTKGESIPWVRIHEIPDHAKFPHKRHVKAGVSCQECHGEVQNMEKVYQFAPLNMGWCMDCHRGVTTPENAVKTIRARENQEVKAPHVAPVNCSTCHY